jgi:hypothetical protein
MRSNLHGSDGDSAESARGFPQTWVDTNGSRSRQILYFNITAHPTAEWTTQAPKSFNAASRSGACPDFQGVRRPLQPRTSLFGSGTWHPLSLNPAVFTTNVSVPNARPSIPAKWDSFPWREKRLYKGSSRDFLPLPRIPPDWDQRDAGWAARATEVSDYACSRRPRKLVDLRRDQPEVGLGKFVAGASFCVKSVRAPAVVFRGRLFSNRLYLVQAVVSSVRAAAGRFQLHRLLTPRYGASTICSTMPKVTANPAASEGGCSAEDFLHKSYA